LESFFDEFVITQDNQSAISHGDAEQFSKLFDIVKQEQVEFLFDLANHANKRSTPWSWWQLLDFSVLDD
jgi:adenosine deaminase